MPAVCAAVNTQRLLDTAVRLIARPSPTGSAGAAADELAAILTEDGFAVERPTAGHPAAPAVVARLSSGRPGRTLQFNGHLDTVHLPFVAPKVSGDVLTGSGSADMKGGIAAAVEAVRAVRDAGGLAGGSILLTAHDLHESPWGDGSQLDRLVADGHVGSAVLIPEYFNATLPVIGRGGFTWAATIRRPGPPVHEVYRPDEPSVIAAGAELVARLGRLDAELGTESDPFAGAASAYVGLIQSGSIYNEYPQTCRLEGTRRWLPGTRFADADRQFRTLCTDLATSTGTTIDVETRLMRDAFRLDTADPFVTVFQSAYATLIGERLPIGGKPFVDDGNSFWCGAGVPAVTHGPTAGGAHTTAEWVNVGDLVRVARLYALVATMYCPLPSGGEA
ncbi:M20 family metallopeptidase [Fimbriiglobus ruber]|uniref:Acetylornithine deacetylase n=1 Tax=Fimbriiglobus ruber TaxID=1908690 RepID=A0A225DLA6_9BACT|nr:M20/M25/M40 family metallo-hydrolase [Fimbriiglobus ruber]OWK38256.1 Acetylornithine deacetylase [Fimbriiglobus ruber]